VIVNSRLGEFAIASLALRQQIDHDLLDLHPVHHDRRRMGRELGAHRDVDGLGSDHRQRDGVLGDGVDALDRTFAVPLLDEVAQPADDQSGALSLVTGLGEGFLRLGRFVRRGQQSLATFI